MLAHAAFKEGVMVSIFTILALVFSLIACFVFPIVLCIVFMKKTRPGPLSLIMGIIVFIVFVFILEQLMHYAFLVAIPATKTLFENNVWLYATYGAFAAGIFEEGGRFLAFSIFLKKKREWKHGIAYGIGHGGIEALLLATPGVLNSLIYTAMINSGTYDALIKTQPKVTADLLLQARDTLLTEAPWMFALTGVERICAISFQIALSVLVLYAVYKKRYMFIGLAVLIHAAIDFPAVLFQRGLLPLWSVEAYCVVLAVPALIFIIWSRKLFPAAPAEPLPEPVSEGVSS